MQEVVRIRTESHVSLIIKRNKIIIVIIIIIKRNGYNMKRFHKHEQKTVC
jgi:hypothetical protein